MTQYGYTIRGANTGEVLRVATFHSQGELSLDERFEFAAGEVAITSAVIKDTAMQEPLILNEKISRS